MTRTGSGEAVPRLATPLAADLGAGVRHPRPTPGGLPGRGLRPRLAEAGARHPKGVLATGGREPLAQAGKGRCKDGGTTGWRWRARGQTSS